MIRGEWAGGGGNHNQLTRYARTILPAVRTIASRAATVVCFASKNDRFMCCANAMLSATRGRCSELGGKGAVPKELVMASNLIV